MLHLDERWANDVRPISTCFVKSAAIQDITCSEARNQQIRICDVRCPWLSGWITSVGLPSVLDLYHLLIERVVIKPNVLQLGFAARTRKCLFRRSDFVNQIRWRGLLSFLQSFQEIAERGLIGEGTSQCAARKIPSSRRELFQTSGQKVP